MAQATIRFSDLKIGKKLDGSINRHIGWDVIDYTDEDDACNACAQPGDEHPQDSQLKCTDVAVQENKLTKAIVLGTYAYAHAPLILWRPGKNSQDVDTDLNGNPILNSIGDAFKSYGKRNFSVQFLTITKWETYYDQTTANKYRDTVNSTAVSFDGNSFDPGQVYCISIAPRGEYQSGTNWMQISYAFEIRVPSPLATGLTSLQKRHPFQRRILDQGMRGKFANPSTGTIGFAPFHFGSGQACTRDVLLDGTGKPLDAEIGITEAGFVAQPGGVGKGVLVDKIGTTATFLVYMDYPEVDFSGIGVAESS